MNQEITDITDKIKKSVSCEQIYLFGSYAYGTPNKDSDYDFYVIIPDNSIRPIEAIKKVYNELSKTKMRTPVDVLALNVSKFRERISMPTLEKKVSEEGVILYERQ